MKQKKRGRERGEGGEGEGGSLGETVVSSACTTCRPVAMAAVPNQPGGTTWLASMAGREEKGRERREGRITLR